MVSKAISSAGLGADGVHEVDLEALQLVLLHEGEGEVAARHADAQRLRRGGAGGEGRKGGGGEDPGHFGAPSVRVKGPTWPGGGAAASPCRPGRRASAALARRRHSRQEAAHGSPARRAAVRGLRRALVRLGLIAAASAVLLVLLFRWVDPPITYLMAREWWRLGASSATGCRSRRCRPTCRCRRRRRRTRTSAATPGSISTASARRWPTTGGCAAGRRSASRWRRTSFSGRSGRGCARGWRRASPCWSSSLWPKRRIMEVYLNVAEMGEGLFGADAAARRLLGPLRRRARAGALRPADGGAARPARRARRGAAPRFIAERGAAISAGAATIRADGRAACFL